MITIFNRKELIDTRDIVVQAKVRDILLLYFRSKGVPVTGKSIENAKKNGE